MAGHILLIPKVNLRTVYVLNVDINNVSHGFDLHVTALLDVNFRWRRLELRLATTHRTGDDLTRQRSENRHSYTNG